MRALRVPREKNVSWRQPRQDPALRDLHGDLDLRFVPRFGRPGRQDGGAVVGGELLVGALQAGLIATRHDDAALELVAHDSARDAAEEGEGPGMAGDPVRHLLGAGGLGVGVVGGAEDGDEELGRADLAGGRLDEPRLLAGVIDEALLAGAVDLAHRQAAPLQPASVQIAEPGVAIAVGVLLQVFEVEQLEGDAGLAPLGVDPGAVRRRTLALTRHLGPTVEPALQDLVGQHLDLEPVQAGGLGPGQHAGDRAQAESDAPAHGPVAQPQGPLLSKDLSDLPHG
jgi:hypothetical protein